MGAANAGKPSRLAIKEALQLRQPLEMEELPEGASPALQAAFDKVRDARRVYDPIVQWLSTRRDMPLSAGNLQDALEALEVVRQAENRFWITWLLESTAST